MLDDEGGGGSISAHLYIQVCQLSHPTTLIMLMTYNPVASCAVTSVLFMKCSKLIM